MLPNVIVDFDLRVHKPHSGGRLKPYSGGGAGREFNREVSAVEHKYESEDTFMYFLLATVGQCAMRIVI